jgi:hypothetical protein
MKGGISNTRGVASTLYKVQINIYYHSGFCSLLVSKPLWRRVMLAQQHALQAENHLGQRRRIGANEINRRSRVHQLVFSCWIG